MSSNTSNTSNTLDTYTSTSPSSSCKVRPNTVKSTLAPTGKLSNPLSVDDMILCYTTINVNDLTLSEKNLILCEYPSMDGCNRLFSKTASDQDKWIARVMGAVQRNENPYK
jgi:hypothetical protein